MVLSPQSQAIYKTLLAANRSLSAKELASRLHIFNASVYRLAESLIRIGLISKIKARPYKFMAKSTDEGLSLFLLSQNEWFTRQFLSVNNKVSNEKKSLESDQIEFSFIQSRDELMSQSAKEIAKATKSVDLLRSGHEIPVDVMLAVAEARERNVITRMLIQDYSEENSDQVANWRKNGILVRKTNLHHVRLMIYDASIVYFMSYKHVDSGKDLGMKISYPPFAVILSKLFEDWWREAVKI